MGGNHSAWVNGHEPFGNGMVARGGINPKSRAIKAGIARGFARQAQFMIRARAHIAGINGQQFAGPHRSTGNGNAAQLHGIILRPHLKGIANAELRQDKAQLSAQLFANAGNARQ